MPLITFAAVVTEDNTQSMIEIVAKLGLNISDDLDGIIEEYATIGEIPMGILHISEDEEFKNAAFAVIGSDTFSLIFEFDQEIMYEDLFTQAHRL